MVEQRRIDPEWFRREDHCQLCGEKFDKFDEWNQIQAEEVYTAKDGKVSRKVKAQWHVFCIQTELGEVH